MPSGWEIILILGILFLLFGASQLPKLARSIGRSRVAFRKAVINTEDGNENDETLSSGE